MKKKNLLEKIAVGKGFYVAVALSLCLIILAAVIIYRTSTDMLGEILALPEEITQQARQNETDEADPRYDVSFSFTLPQEENPTETSPRWDSTTQEETTVPAETTLPPIINESYILPCDGGILRDYSPDIPTYDITMGDWRTHKGIDFFAAEGSEIKSVGNGRVVRVLSDRSYGFTIEIDHGDFTARYCGLSQENALKLGDTVSKGDTVGLAGAIPCEAAEENHFHFEVIKNGVYSDPIEEMKLMQE